MAFLKKVLNLALERDLKTAADLFIYHNDYAGALEMVQRALLQDPTDKRAMVLHGDVMFCLNRDIDALQILDEVLSLYPDLPEAYLSKAGVYEALGKYREALQCCRKALSLLTPRKQYLLESIFDQEIALLIKLKRYRQARSVLGIAKTALDTWDFNELASSYRTLIEEACKRRQQYKLRAKALSMHTVPGYAS